MSSFDTGALFYLDTPHPDIATANAHPPVCLQINIRAQVLHYQKYHARTFLMTIRHFDPESPGTGDSPARSHPCLGHHTSTITANKIGMLVPANSGASL
jgi:hypothetical protein